MGRDVTRRAVIAGLGLGSGGVLVGCGGDPPESRLTPESTTTFASETSSSSSSSASPTSGTAVEVEGLPSPDDLRNRWAAYAAAWGATESSTGVPPGLTDAKDWYYTTALGHYAYLLRYKDDRAVLVGSSDTGVFDRDDAQEKAARDALLAGRPDWWGSALEDLPDNAHLGFLCAWDGKIWQENERSTSRGGVQALDFVPRSQRETGETLVLMGTGGEESYRGRWKTAADAVMKAGPVVTEKQLEALGDLITSAKDGVELARGFDEPPSR